jgi:phosphohistidine phosphatase
MRLIVVRHAQAVPQARGVADADRPLTVEGERRFRISAQGIARLTPRPDALLTSPLLRARQTAALLAAAWGDLPPILEPGLGAGDVDAIVSALAARSRDAAVALVGHEPTVSALVSELLGVSSSEAIGFEPGAAALLELASVARRSARLVWFLPPPTTQ